MVEQLNSLVDKYQCAFTSSNVSLLVNEKQLLSVKELFVSDGKDLDGSLITHIMLKRVVLDGNEDLIDDMRVGKFSFKLVNNSTSSGYISPECELETFEMVLSREDTGTVVNLLEQNLLIKTKSFMYVRDARSVNVKNNEDEDLKNLKRILKENQERVKKSKEEASNKLKVEFSKALAAAEGSRSAIIPKEEITDLHDGDILWVNLKKPEKHVKKIKAGRLSKGKK